MNLPPVLTNRVTVAENGCWLWKGKPDPRGYCKWARQWAHRRVYELLVGPIPEGHDVGHRCHDEDKTCAGGVVCLHRRCVNPAHLEPQTRRENLRRGNGVTARRARQTHCVHGHEFTPANTAWKVRRPGANPTRSCRSCHNARSRARTRLRRG